MRTPMTLTGQLAEDLGAMKFECAACKDLFPARCDTHRVLVVFEGDSTPPTPKDHRRLELRLELHQRRKVLAFGRPIVGYDAPYEVLTAEIERIPLGVRD